MEYNIKLNQPKPDLWPRLNENGFYLHRQKDGIIYKYVSFDTALNILKGNCLQYSLPAKFNDPFDLTLDLLDTSISIDEIKKRIQEQFKTTEEFKQAIINYNLSNPNFFSEIFKNGLNDAKSNIGITCFSKSQYKTLMWSHYADKHAGVCLGFSFKDDSNEGLIQMGIKYSSNIEPTNYFQDTIYCIYNWIFTKSNIWNYEEEVRRVFINKHGLINFDKTELIEIYYGLNLQSEKITEIQSILQDYNISKEVKMEMDKNKFDLKPKVLQTRENTSVRSLSGRV